MVAPSATIEILRRRRALRRQEAVALRARRRTRVLASGAAALGFVIALVLVFSGLTGAGDGRMRIASGVAGAAFTDVGPDAEVLSTLVVGARANRSIVTVEAGGVTARGFVAWRDSSYSYVLLPHAAAIDVLRAGGRDVDVA